MNKKELIKMLMKRMEDFGYFPSFTNVKIFIQEYEKLAKPEPQAGHADEAPRYVRNVIARLRELPFHDREVWLKAIMDEFEEDFCHSIWREGYEQGKFEGALEVDKKQAVVLQFVADWYEENKDDFEFNVWDWIAFRNEPEKLKNKEFNSWINDGEGNPIQTLVNMHQFGYEVEKEKRYKVVMPNVSSAGGVLTRIKHDDSWIWIDTLGTIVEGRTHTRKELEEADFGWVFDCPGIEVQEVEE